MNDTNNINFNTGNFTLINSDISIIRNKNFIGYDDDDYELVNELNNFDINFSCKNNGYINNNLIIKSKGFIGFNNEQLKDLNEDTILNVNGDIETNSNLFSNNIFVDNDIKVDGISNLNNVYIKESLSLNNNLIFNNTIELEEECILQLDYKNNLISIESFKYLLNNVIENIINLKKKYFGINFIGTSFIRNMIISINKKFIYNKEDIFCCGLFYIIFYKNKLITSKPILDTFILFNSMDELIKIK